MTMLKKRLTTLIGSAAVALTVLGLGSTAQAQSAVSCRSTACKPNAINSIGFGLKSSDIFTDISGLYGETEILQLAELGVISATPEFQPLAPISRSQFIAWMVRSYNELHPNPIRLPAASASPFPDVPATHPHGTYIQAARDAGLLAGFDDGSFRPDEILTREHMIVLKTFVDTTARDNGSRSTESLFNYLSRTRGISDADRMSAELLWYIAFDQGNAASARNFERIYGRTHIYGPQEPVTRAEAAVLLSQFRRGITAERELQRRQR